MTLFLDYDVISPFLWSENDKGFYSWNICKVLVKCAYEKGSVCKQKF